MKFHKINVIFVIAPSNGSKIQFSRPTFCHYFDEMSTCNSMTIFTKIRKLTFRELMTSYFRYLKTGPACLKNSAIISVLVTCKIAYDRFLILKDLKEIHKHSLPIFGTKEMTNSDFNLNILI